MSSLRVAVCGMKDVPSCAGGIERGVEELTTRLLKRGYDVTLFCRATEAGEGMHRGLSVRNITYTSHKYLCYFTYMLHVTRLLLRERHEFDLVHVHTPSHNGLWVLVLRLFGIRTLIHSHGLEWMADKWPLWFKVVMRIIEFIGAATANQIVTVSAVEQAHFERLVNKVPVERVPNGFPFVPQLPDVGTYRKCGVERGGYYLFVGRIVPQKCVLEMVRAFLLCNSAKNLLIVGGPSYTDAYMQEVRECAGADLRIRFVGPLQQSEIFSLYVGCFAFILPSDHEGCPNVLLEALACGCHCLVSDIAAHREIVGLGWPFIDVHNMKTFAGTITAIERSSAALARYRRSIHPDDPLFPSWDDVAQQFDRIYRRLLEGTDQHASGPAQGGIL